MASVTKQELECDPAPKELRSGQENFVKLIKERGGGADKRAIWYQEKPARCILSLSYKA